VRLVGWLVGSPAIRKRKKKIQATKKYLTKKKENKLRKRKKLLKEVKINKQRSPSYHHHHEILCAQSWPLCN